MKRIIKKINNFRSNDVWEIYNDFLYEMFLVYLKGLWLTSWVLILCDLFGVVTTKVGGVNAIKILIIGLFIGIFDGY